MMSGWVCSARKFVVSSFVSFAEELENAVHVLTDQPQEDVKSGQKSPSHESGAIIKRSPTVIYVTSGVVGANHALALFPASDPITQRPSALTTQPQPSGSVLSSTASMSSLSIETSSENSVSLLKSAPYSRSMPEIASASKAGGYYVSSSNFQPSTTSSRIHSQKTSVHRSKNSRHLSLNKTASTDEEIRTPYSKSIHTTPKNFRDKNVFTLKRPGKVVRTSTSEAKSTYPENGQCGSIHVVEDTDEWTQIKTNSDETNQYPSMLFHHTSSHPTPEDLTIQNRSTHYALDECNLEHIQKVSLMDKLTKIVHSTLITISNLLRLENEDIMTISGTERICHTSNNDTTLTNGICNASQISQSVENCFSETANENNLTLSRINSLVSLESFEVLSKEDDNIVSCESIFECQIPSNKIQNSQDNETSSEDFHESSKYLDKDGECLDMQMTSSIEFIQFEVSDLITKRYFDSKTQRLAHSANLVLQDEVKNKTVFQNVETSGQVNPKENNHLNKADLELSSGEDDDGSSISFDIISEETCKESFHFV